MILSNFLLISLLILLPSEMLQNSGPEAVSCNYQSSCSGRKKEYANETMTRSCYKGHHSKSTNRRTKSPVPVKVHCDHGAKEKSGEERRANKKEEEVCRQELEAAKKSAKNHVKRRDQHSESNERRKREDLSKGDNTRMPTKKQNAMYAECEQCELQMKSNGEGVMVKCTNCRIVSADEVAFPAGKTKKIVKFP